MKVPTITTSRLNLRPLTIDDAEPLHIILGQPGVLRFFPNSSPPPLEKVKTLIAGQIKHWDDYGYGWWAVEEQGHDQLMGWSGLQYLPETDETEVGYLLGSPYWGRGIATESAKAGLKFGFTDLNIDTIVAIVHPENKASIRVIEKLGLAFTYGAVYFGMDAYRYELGREDFFRHVLFL